jgi:hypothetical protein
MFWSSEMLFLAGENATKKKDTAAARRRRSEAPASMQLAAAAAVRQQVRRSVTEHNDDEASGADPAEPAAHLLTAGSSANQNDENRVDKPDQLPALVPMDAEDSAALPEPKMEEDGRGALVAFTDEPLLPGDVSCLMAMPIRNSKVEIIGTCSRAVLETQAMRSVNKLNSTDATRDPRGSFTHLKDRKGILEDPF